MTRIRIVLADDLLGPAELLKIGLEREADLSVISMALTPAAAVYKTTELGPDLLVTEILFGMAPGVAIGPIDTATTLLLSRIAGP